MGSDTTAVPGANPTERWMYRVGGGSALLLAAGYLVILGLYASVGAPPNGDGAAWLAYLAGKLAPWWGILGLSVLTDFLFVPFGFGLYFALRRVHEGAVLLATALVFLFVVLDLAITWPEYAALLALGAQHSVATDEAQRAGYVAAAHRSAAVLTSRLFVVYAIVTLSSAMFALGVVMRRSAFAGATAWLGVLTGIFGVFALGGFGGAVILNATCATAFILLAGYRLVQLARA